MISRQSVLATKIIEYLRMQISDDGHIPQAGRRRNLHVTLTFCEKIALISVRDRNTAAFKL